MHYRDPHFPNKFLNGFNNANTDCGALVSGPQGGGDAYTNVLLDYKQTEAGAELQSLAILYLCAGMRFSRSGPYNAAAPQQQRNGSP